MSSSQTTNKPQTSARLTKEAEKHWNTDYPLLRPKDAATLIILDRSTPSQPRLLMGRRHMRHKFMPGLYVFPGGRVDRGDGRVPASQELNPVVEAKLLKDMKRGPRPSRARALVLAAIRETYEEAGLLIGSAVDPAPSMPADWFEFGARGILPDLSSFRLLARAITPPRRNRRFDTRFFIVDASAISARLESGTGPSGELEDLHWLTIPEALNLKLPGITIQILEDLEERMRIDPDLSPDHPAPYYYWRPSGMIRDEI
ncbi:NUDIX hydrolase [Coralliovum pocilloporae]|uniref:NUDIX hydrolase n=1 Tax=Coralliovum pocilloporae TaxID=3066369 RepID=UPI003306DDF8